MYEYYLKSRNEKFSISKPLAVLKEFSTANGRVVTELGKQNTAIKELHGKAIYIQELSRLNIFVFILNPYLCLLPRSTRRSDLFVYQPKGH